MLRLRPAPAHRWSSWLPVLVRVVLVVVAAAESSPAKLLALDEAATNAILYGSGGGDPVEVAVRVQDAWVEATVLDHGPTRPPRLLSTTDRPSGRGWGLWLLCCLVDEVRLERVEGGRRVTLRRRIRPPSAGTGGGAAPSAAHAVR